MKNVKLVFGAIVMMLVGIFVGSKILSNKAPTLAPDSKLIEKYADSLLLEKSIGLELQNKSINQILELYSKDATLKSTAANFRILSNRHSIENIDYIKMRDAFWKENTIVSPDSIYYNKTTIEDICKLYRPDKEQDWIEFKPTDDKKSGDIGYNPVTIFNKTTSCYPIPLFLGIRNLMNDTSDKLYITKGKTYIVVDGAPPALHTIILFRLVLKGKPSKCYNISTDPLP